MKKSFFKKPSTKIVFRYCLIALLFILLFAMTMPTLLNYPPESINTPFDIKMSNISYTQQYTIIATIIILLIYVSTKILLKSIDKWYLNKNKENISHAKLQDIRKKCFNIPYLIFIFEMILPIIGTVIVLASTGSHHSVMLLKIATLVLAVVFLLAVITYIFSKGIYDEILASTYTEGINIGFRLNLKSKILLQILPVFVSVLIFCSFIGFSTNIKEIANSYFNIYHSELTETFDVNKNYTLNEVKTKLSELKSYNTKLSRFVIVNGEAESLEGDFPTDFMIAYTQDLSDKHDGRTYDSYGVDVQGATIKLNTDQGIVYAGVFYEVSSTSIVRYLVLTSVILILLVIVVLHYFAKALSRDIQAVTEGLNNICNESTMYNSKLPVVSNDEFGDLIQAFNNVQALNVSHVKSIQNNQDILVEQERLASLGQMIGGIAHNLKTPIFSIAGGLEGLTDLINEYDASIENDLVTDEDMHAIAGDMREWIEKLRGHVSYMSDVITAVKGQTVALSDTEAVDFSVSELFKRVDILMKHELKNALADLKIVNEVADRYCIHGNINSLVQILNNIISNALDAYASGNYTDKKVELHSIIDNNKIVISVTDFGPGISKVAQEKLFKKMVTTKGKNGTGLGMFMSYSNIKAHFNGDMSYETELGKGTTFYITLPIKSALTL